MDPLSFWIGGTMTLTSGMMMVTRRNAVASVMWLVAAFLGMAVLFLGMDAGFIGVIQILVYAGAILVLFLFVIMLLNLTPSGLARLDGAKFKVFGVGAAALFVGAIVSVALVSGPWGGDRVLENGRVAKGGGTAAAILARTAGESGEPAARLLQGDVAAVADQLFTAHLLPFEVASVLLLVAILGSVVLTKRKL